MATVRRDELRAGESGAIILRDLVDQLTVDMGWGTGLLSSVSGNVAIVDTENVAIVGAESLPAVQQEPGQAYVLVPASVSLVPGTVVRVTGTLGATVSPATGPLAPGPSPVTFAVSKRVSVR